MYLITIYQTSLSVDMLKRAQRNFQLLTRDAISFHVHQTAETTERYTARNARFKFQRV